jgi:AraC-like DNA-binding protein
MLRGSVEVSQTLRRSLPPVGSWTVVRAIGLPQLERALETRLVDAIVFSPHQTGLSEIAQLRNRFPFVPWIAFAPFRPDDGEALETLRQAGVSQVLVQGVDDPVAGELVARHSALAERRRALMEAPRMLRLADTLQRSVWNYLLDRVDQTVRTGEIARSQGCTREHLSRQFAAGGAPNLKRAIDLSRVTAAAALLRNPGYDVARVARVLRFATPSHLSATARRIAGVPASGLAPLGPRGVLLNFARGKTRSRV